MDPRRLQIYRLLDRKLHCIGAGSYGRVSIQSPWSLRQLSHACSAKLPQTAVPDMQVSSSLSTISNLQVFKAQLDGEKDVACKVRTCKS